MAKATFWSIIGGLLISASAHQAAAVTVGVDPAAPWQGYMNVSELPANGGAFVFGNPWGAADLVATFSGPVLTLAPNVIGDPAGFWYTPSGGPGAAGNKIMEANMYVETTGVYTGVPLTFEGTVLTNTFTSAHSTVAFIKDFDAGYATFNVTAIPLTAPGPFSITLETVADPTRHVQYGFATTGVNVWVTDVAPFGNLTVTASGGGGPSADFNDSGTVTGADLGVWQVAYGLTAAGDANGDTFSDGDDFLIWQQQLNQPAISAIPEPASATLLLATLGLTIALARRRS